ncbi:sugar-binding protein [Bradymonas sediminis]|nr:sugar-binding protein [Bradymonas sediminis]TDP62885.1 carbohydrate binding protein with CBM9 domain [Bradymonas sediminis]
MLVLTCLLSMAAFSVGCSSSKSHELDPFGLADEPDPNDLLDEEIKPRRGTPARARRSAAVDQPLLVLPLPKAETSKTIDGDFSDWNTRKVRTFGSSKHIVTGEEFWGGAKDASFSVGVEADEGYVYFSVAVRDDVVIDAESQDIMSDGVIIWLQDPKLESVIASLPDGMAKRHDIGSESAILFTPDGQFWRFDRPDGALHRAGITAATKKTKDGYNVEVALTLGVIGQVATLPTEAVAFRVELLDGDEAGRRGEQTRLSMLPDPLGPRFARYEVGGWLPFSQAKGQPPRPGALGRWVLNGDTWYYDSFEVVPNSWLLLQDTSEFEETLAKTDVFDEICPLATSERELVEAYQSTRGTQRAGLLLCGPRAPGNRCPSDAQSELYWLNLERQGEDWSLAKHAKVTPEPLQQCAKTPRKGGDFYSEFSLLPLEMLGPTVWGIGWHKGYSDRKERSLERGVWFANPDLPTPYMGTAIAEKTRARTRERTLSKSHVYLALVDDVAGLDICEVERIQEQQCSGLDRRCATTEFGESVQVHVKLWSPHKQRFETYLQTKHRGCSAATFDFNERRGFMLLVEPGRLGALASPANPGSKRRRQEVVAPVEVPAAAEPEAAPAPAKGVDLF